MPKATLDPDALAVAIGASTPAREAPLAPGESSVQRARAITVIEISAYLKQIDDDHDTMDDPRSDRTSGRLFISSAIASVAALLISVFSLGIVIGQSTGFQQNGHPSLSMVGVRP